MPRPPALILSFRLFHWLFAAGVVAAATIALALGPRHALFSYHATIGLALAALVILRLLVGVLGAGPARAGPRPPRPARRSPVPVLIILAMPVLLLGLAATGIAMNQGSRGLAPIHKIMSYALVAASLAHILGVIMHAPRTKTSAPPRLPDAGEAASQGIAS